MKRVLQYSILLIIILGLSSITQAASSISEIEQTNEQVAMNAQWTAMYYLCGDNKMSASQDQHLQEIVSVGSTNDVQIAVLIDQNQDDDTRLYYLNGNQLEQQDWVEESAMDDPDTLEQFIQTVKSDLPSSQYYLQLSSNKGSGWQGVCYDERGDGTMITMTELSSLLSDVTGQGSQKIDVMAVETCLGGNLEFAYQVKGYCDYYVGYADCGLVGDWPFEQTISALTDNPSMQPSELASTIVDEFTPRDVPQYQLMTAIGAIDLSRISQVKDNIDALSNHFIDNIETYQTEIEDSLENIRIYGEMWNIDYYIDFIQFLNNVEFIDQEGENLKDQFISSVQSMIVNKKHLAEDDCEGFNFYFPRRSNDFNHALRYDNGVLPDSYDETLFSIESSWDDFLKQFLGIANNNAPNKPTINGPQNGAAGEEYEYQITSSDPENDQLYYFIDWGDNTDTNWIGPYDSDEEITLSHTWIEVDTYTMKVKTKDDKGAESDWTILTVSMPKRKSMISDTVTTILIGKISDIERDQNQGFRFLPIRLLKIIFGGEEGFSFERLDETNGGYPCCGYIGQHEFQGYLSPSFIFGIWKILVNPNI